MRFRNTAADDGLSQPWFGTVWLNPPFSDKTPWYRRLVGHVEREEVERAAALGPVDPSTDWFQEWFATADTICFLDGRDWFLDHGSSPSFPTMVGVWNPTAACVDWLTKVGIVVRPLRDDAQAGLEVFDR